MSTILDMTRTQRRGIERRRALLDAIRAIEAGGDRATLTTLAVRLGWPRGTVHQHVRLLRDIGLVETTPGRYGYIALTERGQLT